MRVSTYCLLCKKEIIATPTFADAFREINNHLQREHNIAWLSPLGLPLREYAEALLQLFRKRELEEEEKTIVSTIRKECVRFGFYALFFPDGKLVGVITDVFGVYLTERREPFLEQLQKRQKRKWMCRWIWPLSSKYLANTQLLKRYYQPSNEEILRRLKTRRLKTEKKISLKELGLYPELYAGAPREELPPQKERVKVVWRVKQVDGKPCLERAVLRRI